jgi:hypothetical protein
MLATRLRAGSAFVRPGQRTFTLSGLLVVSPAAFVNDTV